MELKYQQYQYMKRKATVLIVPLWNWNRVSDEQIDELIKF